MTSKNSVIHDRTAKERKVGVKSKYPFDITLDITKNKKARYLAVVKKAVYGAEE